LPSRPPAPGSSRAAGRGAGRRGTPRRRRLRCRHPRPPRRLPITGRNGCRASRRARHKADNLQRISGVGPKLKKTLHDLGFFHYEQIAAWDPSEVTWINEHLRFRGRVEREQWIEQARLLANGEEERFTQIYAARAPRDEEEAAEALRGRRGQGTSKS
jgi:NADH-quinone oxidoreductase subunit E